MEEYRYKHLNTYLKHKFGERTLKVCIDAGFTCPNRDGKLGYGGCVFCGSSGAGDNIKRKLHSDNKCDSVVLRSISNQVTEFLKSYRGERANKYIAYFQSYSNTYADVETLKCRYDVALSASNKFVGLEVATRPDCINEEVAQLLSSYQDKYYVCVELGLQIADDDILSKLNVGYTVRDFEQAVNILHKYRIDVVAHVMIGLPNESIDIIGRTIALINRLGCEGIKIHSTYVQKGTCLASSWSKGEYVSISQDYYVNIVARLISNLNKDIVIHRVTADPPRGECLAPDWVTHKKLVINDIERYLKDKDIVQGDCKLDFTN